MHSEIMPWQEEVMTTDRSNDYGLTWSNTGLPYTAVNALAVYNEYLFVGTNNGIYYSIDQGETLIEINQGFNGIPIVTSLMIDDIYLYAGTRHYSVWRRPISDIITGIENPTQEKFLDQNYPNPVTGKTRIGFELEKAGHVRLSLFNMSGYQVAVILDAFNPTGKHYVDFDGTDLPSGIYLYRIETEDYSYSRRMVVISK